MAIKQGIFIRGINNNAKYKMKYTISQKATTENELTTIKYTYSKLITSLINKKKYSYN